MKGMEPKHIVLIGDSIFDNGGYVDEGDSLIEQLNRKLPENTKATLLAVDGDVTNDVYAPVSYTHLTLPTIYSV